MGDSFMDNRHGFIRDKLDIKILILFVMRRIDQPMTIDELTEVAICDDGISYFDFAECLSELVSTNHVEYDGTKYSITQKGIKNGGVTESTLPYSVRVRAEKNTAVMSARLSRGEMISTSRMIRRGGGYTVTLAMSDGIDDVLNMQLYASSEKQASRMEKAFREKAEKIYSNLLKELTD